MRIGAHGCVKLFGPDFDRQDTASGCLKRILQEAVHRDNAVSDAVRQKTMIIKRLRRLQRQIQAIQRALDQERDRSDLLPLIASARATINRLMAEVLENYIRMQVVDPTIDAEQARANERLIEVIHSYLK